MDLAEFRAIDQHAHNVLKPEAWARYPFAAAFSESSYNEVLQRDTPHTLFYQRSLRDLAELLNCEPSEKIVLEQRAKLGLEGLAQICFASAKLDGLLLDDGFLPDDLLPLEWHEQFVPVTRVLRLEALAQDLFGETDRFEVFLERFRAQLENTSSKVVAFKSIVAYRTGLDIQPVFLETARSRYRTLQAQGRGKPIRLADKPLIDFLLGQALEIAASREIPLQLHTGFGDPDLDLRMANPLHLRGLLEDHRYRKAPLVLLHAAYPYTGEAGYLASVYPQVHVDFGLAVPFLSVAGMRRVLRTLLELAPTNKVLYSSDAHFIPELFYLGAKWGRRILGEVLDRAVADGDLTTLEADEAAVAILSDNARRLYRLP
jgi:predicted TIM-barrel fold metal-dependent hydrolase